MKKIYIVSCVVLLLAIGAKATPAIFSKENNYWVTETGPRSNPYTIIRLYDEAHTLLTEIIMNGYRLKTQRRAMIKRLNRLANAAKADGAANIAALLCIDERRVLSVKKYQ